MQHAYSVITVKSLDSRSDALTIEGIASTPTPDRAGDIVVPTGAKFTLPMPLLLNHRHDLPVGKVVYAAPTARGVPFSARLPRIKSAGKLKDRVDEAIDSLESGLISAVSVGFVPVIGKARRLSSGGTQYDEWAWHELSLCTVPVQGEAVITAVKAMGHASTAGRMSPELIRQIKVASFSGSRAGVQLIPHPRGPVKLLRCA